jgi:hypothetical protein
MVLELFEQVVIDRPRIDKNAGIIYRAHVLGLKSNNGYSYAINGLKSVYSKYEQMPVSIDHDYGSSQPTVGRTWGTLTNPTCDEEGIWADLHYLRSHPLTEQVIEDVERGTGLFSLSTVNGGVIQKGRIIEKFSPMRCDLVVKGATTRTLLEQEHIMETIIEEVKVGGCSEEPVVAEPVVVAQVVTFEQYQSLETKCNDLIAKVVELEKRLELHNEYLSPKTTLEQTIAATVAGIDLKEFWKS